MNHEIFVLHLLPLKLMGINRNYTFYIKENIIPYIIYIIYKIN